VLIDGDRERRGGVAEDGGDDHWLNALPAELGGDGVTDVVQAVSGCSPARRARRLNALVNESG